MARFVNETEIAQWYCVIPEQQRQAILSALSEQDRRRAFQYGLSVSWHLLPDYAKDLVAMEYHAIRTTAAAAAV